MSLATVAHSLKHHAGCKVIWVDAHADINTFEASTTKNIHGMPLAYLTALSHNPRYSFIHNTLRFDRLLYVGLRSIDAFEQNILDKHRIPYFTSDDINNHKADCLSAIDVFLKDSPFHLSFDVDGLDPEVIKHTGKGYVSKAELKELGLLIDKVTQDIYGCSEAVNVIDATIKAEVASGKCRS